MIIAILIVSLLAFTLSVIFAKKIWRPIFIFIFGCCFIFSVVAIIGNDHYHWGMEKETKENSQPLVSSSAEKGMNLLLYKQLGTGSEKVYIYRTKETQKKASVTGTDTVTNQVKTVMTTPKLKIKTTRWVYKNDFYSLLFGISKNNQKYDSRVYTFEVGKDWLILSTDQATAFGKAVKAQEASIKEGATEYVKSKLTSEMTKNSTMSQVEQQQLTAKYAAEYQQQAIAKILSEIKK